MQLPVSPEVAANAVGNIENLVTLTSGQYTMGSLILMVSYGAHFAFILYFLMTSMQLAPRYRIVPIMSAIVMASAGLSLLREFTTWQDAYTLVGASYVPMQGESIFTNAFRYGNWTITVPILLTQLPIAFAISRPDLHKRAIRMSIPAVLMIWTGLYGQFGETGDFSRLNIWGVISTIFFVWLIIEVRGVITAAIANSPPQLVNWPKNLWYYFLATWGLYPIAYALPQLGFTGDIVVVRQLLFSIADISTKLIYGIILSRYLLRRSALEGYVPAAEALETSPLGAKVASQRGD
ncbi:bacteriorhodopsin [Paraurantiacibacter namhicola]|uniref:Green-light absorbing proteorhodopsin n=1 Tax=Paraurantiacibacter namhicola TaxID=645517 RepID=A0A1C7DB83_9SPHN|nr:bacteriorhodopsin [Paraurantiacibacter namhicola]ANU08746.1 Green-light absorbing proteorhodopsin precursor [Paraurantiacibacter namhicola]